MAEQYVEQLAAARERIVADRRELADELAKPYERGRYEQWRRIVEVQATIDAIDRAITDERSIKDKGKPVSLVDLVALHSDYDFLAWASRTEASWG